MPCYYTTTGLPCAWGDGCGICHLFHEHQIKSRPRKATWVQRELAADAINALRTADAETLREQIPALSKKVVYVNRFRKSKPKLVERDEAFSACRARIWRRDCRAHEVTLAASATCSMGAESDRGHGRQRGSSASVPRPRTLSREPRMQKHCAYRFRS